MPAKSKQQQKFFGVVKSMQAGDIPKKGAAGKVAKDMSKKEVDKYASTKHKGLPKKVKQETMKKSKLKEMIREEFLKALEEAKMTPGKVQKVQRDLVKTIDALKKNFPMYKAAKESGDEKKLNKHRDIAIKLTKKKKDLEKQMDAALGGLYQDAKLDLKETKLNEANNMYDDVIALKRSFDIFKQQSPELYKQLDAKFKVKDIQKTLGDMQKFMDTPQAYR
tara:strand:+ start:147 stop:809 length:663 start_codon:yes stop_codon:yes gene_type:complete